MFRAAELKKPALARFNLAKAKTLNGDETFAADIRQDCAAGFGPALYLMSAAEEHGPFRARNRKRAVGYFSHAARNNRLISEWYAWRFARKSLSRLLIRTGTIDTEVAIRLFVPEENDGTWSCRYEIDWPNGKKAGAAAGVDSIQAIVLAPQIIGVELYCSDHHKSGSLSWTGPGFPVAGNVRDLLVGDDTKL